MAPIDFCGLALDRMDGKSLLRNLDEEEICRLPLRNQFRKTENGDLGTQLRPCARTTAALVLLGLVISLHSVPLHSEAPADELARKVVTNELKARDEDYSHWMYRLELEKSGTEEVWKIIQTKKRISG